MKTPVLFLLALSLLNELNAATASPLVRLHTTLGIIEAELAADKAPASVANFLRYVDADRYTGGQFHRTVTLHPDNQPFDLSNGGACYGNRTQPDYEGVIVFRHPDVTRRGLPRRERSCRGRRFARRE